MDSSGTGWSRRLSVHVLSASQRTGRFAGRMPGRFAAGLSLLILLLVLSGLAAGNGRVAAAPVPPKAPPLASATPAPCSVYFVDVSDSNPFYAQVEALACQSVLSGYADGTFLPNANITRGQSAKVVANSAAYSDTIPTTQQTFADVPPSQPFWLTVERAALHGVISGYACGGPGEPCDGQQRPYFRPAASVTRGQLAKIVVGAKNFADPIPPTQQTFADIPPTHPFWLFVERAALHGVLSGYACGGPGEPCDGQQRPYFRAGNTATRGQTSKIDANAFFPGYPAPPWLPLLRLGRAEDPDTRMPYTSNTLVNPQFVAMVFNQLVRRSADGQVLPDLAATVPTLDNGGAVYTGSGDSQRLVVTFHLTPGIHWFDGAEVTAADVLYTYNLVMDPNFSAADRTGLLKYASVTSPDPYTVVFSYLSWSEASARLAQDPATYGFLRPYVDAHQPVTDPRYNENFGPILPGHALAGVAAAAILHSPYAQLPWGTGPYYVTRFTPGAVIQLQANPNYNVRPDAPAIPRITSPLIGSATQMANLLASGGLDATTSEDLTPDMLPMLEDLAHQGGAVLVNRASNGFEHLDFETQRAPFDDVRLRQAVAYALDRNAINHALFADGATLINSWLPPGNWASVENPANIAQYPQITSQFQRYPYSPAQANALLDAAGWTGRDADGTRVKNGRRLQIHWLTTTLSYRRTLAQLQQAMLQAVGIASVPDVAPSSVVFADPPDGPLYTGSYGDYGVVQFAWRNDTDEPGGWDLYDSSQIPGPANQYSGSNNLFWSNAQNDQYLRAVEFGLGHNPARVQQYLQQQVVFSADVPSIPLFALPSLALHRPALQNFQMTAEGLLINVNQWSFAP